MKEITTTKLFRSNTSAATIIPKAILKHVDITIDDITSNDISIRWNYEIKDNKIKYSIEFIK